MKQILGIAIATAAAAAACKVDPDYYTDAGPDGGEIEGDAARTEPDAGEGGADGGGGDSDADPGVTGPVVEVLAPQAPASGDFSSDAILTDDDVAVRCKVAPSPDTGSPIDPASVQVTVSGGSEVVEANAQPALVAQEYEAEISLAQFPNGEVSIACEAADTSSESGSDEISTYLDLGPQILVVNPVEGAAYANRVDLFILVEAAPVAASDDGAEPDYDSVEIVVSDQVLTDVTFDAEEGVFEASVVFEDFDPALQGDNTVTVRATNTRADDPVTREEKVVFNADGNGPAIAVTSPEPGELVSGVFTVTADVQDEAGVNSNSVIATIAGEHEFRLFFVAENTYVGSFDSRELGLGLVFPTVVVRARDNVGNESQLGFLLSLDNRPPLLSLDTPQMIEARVNDDGALECSVAFDPLGGDAAVDGQTLPQLSEIRARIEDLGNTASATAGVVVRRAGVDHDNAQLFILDDEEGALIVDTDGDDICDAINPLLVPTSVPQADDEAAVLNLVPVGPAGSSHFAEDPAPPAGCAVISEEDGEDAPEPVCFQSPGSRQISTELGEAPAIFSIAPAPEDQCWGFAFDSVAANISDGFACVATRAADHLGNAGISPPLRVCFDAKERTKETDGGVEGPCLAPMGETVDEELLPDCTGVYNRETDTVDATASCTPPATFGDFAGFQFRRIDLD